MIETPCPSRSAPHHCSASQIDGSPNDSPAWIVMWKFSRATYWNASRCRLGGLPASAPAMSKPTTPDGSASLGRLAGYVRDRRIPLEMCPTSNVQTGAAASIKDHPIGLLRDLSFRVTVNTDNRLMSGVSLSSEFAALDEAFGIGIGEMEWLTINAMKSAFAPFDERLKLINSVIKPGFASISPTS